MLEGRVVIRDCGCWVIRSYGNPSLVLRTYICRDCVTLVTDIQTKMLYLDKVDSVSAPDEDEAQLWLT